MAKYLYGAAVQGIQGFIFQTNELKDIVGASEIVEFICTELFEEFAETGKPIINAAGIIKHIYDDRAECEKTVLNFPQKVMNFAPGITISQAVVEITGGEKFGDVVDKLEDNLKVQRNKQPSAITCGLMGIKRSNNSGLPAIKIKNGIFKDVSANAKEDKGNIKGLCEKAFGRQVNEKEIAYNIGDITEKNDWIAVIHADGNGLGQIVQKRGKDVESFSDFSKKLDQATKNAAVNAFTKIVKPHLREGERIPIRPIVIGGDDFTVIVRADFAIEYVAEFISEFELQTESLLKDKLTACAGVAFIKSSYPFYYGYNLSEALCAEAKKEAKTINKELAPSCIMFHKVQDSFVLSYDDIKRRELMTKEGRTFKFGPYFIDDKQGEERTIDRLLADVQLLNLEDGNKIKSHIRQWISKELEDSQIAQQKKNRVLSIYEGNKAMQKLFDKVTSMNVKSAYKAYDVLSLASVKYQVTKNKED